MADPLESLGVVGQKVLALPADILGIGTRRMTEDVSMMTAKIQDLSSAIVPPTGAGGLSLPQLPPLPGIGTAGMEQPNVAATSRSANIQGVKTTKKTSYLKV